MIWSMFSLCSKCLGFMWFAGLVIACGWVVPVARVEAMQKERLDG